MVVVDDVAGGVEALGDLLVEKSGVEEAFDGGAYLGGLGWGEGVVLLFGELVAGVDVVLFCRGI